MRPEVIDFSQRMEFVLQENDDKSHWSEATQNYLQAKLEASQAKLHNAVCDNKHGEVVKQAVHVANYAMMLADNAVRLQARSPKS